MITLPSVIPAEAGIHGRRFSTDHEPRSWVPTFVGTTDR